MGIYNFSMVKIYLDLSMIELGFLEFLEMRKF